MEPGIELSVASLEGLDEVCVRATNGAFAGEVFAIVENDTLSRLAAQLQGFPRDAADVRDLELGTFDASSVAGGVGLKFRCTDGVGHAEVEVTLRAGAHRGPLRACAQFVITLEASAVDAFVEQLRKMRLEPGSSAVLSVE